MKILIGVSGSIAALKLPEITQELIRTFLDVEIKVIMTETGADFVDEILERKKGTHEEVFDVSGMNFLYESNFEHDDWEHIQHIELRNWADLFLIAPLSANTLAKISNGLCDNTLTDIVRAWSYSKKIIACPAMNTYMWDNPITKLQIEFLEKMGVQILYPVSKRLACNDVGMGGLCDTSTIIQAVAEYFRWHFPVPKEKCAGLPVTGHPGSFQYRRQGYMHTGIDLYTTPDCKVFAAEDGIVVGTGDFTGPSVGTPHWNDTDYVMVEGASGVINYGEITSELKVGDVVKRGDLIGNVVNVLPPEKYRSDVPGHSIYMLHLELYERGTRHPVDWPVGSSQPKELLNPFHFLQRSSNYSLKELRFTQG